VPFGFHFVPNFLNLSIRADEKAAAHDSLVSPPHKFLVAPGPEGLDHFVGRIAEEWEIQFLLGLETLQCFHGIRTGAENGHPALIKLRFCVTKLGRFDRSTRSVGFRKEKDEDAFPLKITQGNLFAFIGIQGEVRGFVANFEHEVLAGIRIAACEGYR